MKRIFPIFLGAVLLAPLPSFAATFDEECAPTTEHTPGVLAPNVGFILDRSGSMGSASSVSGKTRWEAAKDAINETVDSFTTDGACSGQGDPKCDAVRFGLGLFSSSASFGVPVDEDSKDDIASELGVNPSGRTRMGLAAEELESESSLNESGRSNHAIFITDGYPYDSCDYDRNQDTLVDAVIALCAASARTNPLMTNVIGFGGDTHAQTLHLLAASGGTGRCCDPSDCSNLPIDVCALERSDLNDLLDSATRGRCDKYALPDPGKIACTGAIDITSNTELKNAISGIVQDAACTFPLEIPASYPDPNASADPDFTRVEISHSVYGNIVLGNVGDCDSPSLAMSGTYPPVDEGWCFVNNRRGIRVTSQLCADIGASDIDKVFTQVACLCSLTGGACSITDVMCNGVQCTPDQLANMPCSAGEYICDAGNDVCAPTGNGKLPEICNGVDDNCDGKVDNLGESEPDWDALATPAQKKGTGLHCEFQDVCACEPGVSAPVTISGGVDALLTSAIPECVCQANLEFDESPIAGEEDNNQQDKSAACSALSNGPTGLLYILLPIGLIGFIRRRRRS